MWIFGYGSLLFRPGFAFEERVPSALPGFVRRFFQGSPDHRGTPEAPGRVVTLAPEPGGRCIGVAYRVPAARWEEALLALDLREQGGYARIWREVFPLEGGAPLSALVYYAAPDNPHYLGPAPLQEMARQIAASHGPSGANRDYLLQLAEALHALGAKDEHVAQLASCLRALEAPSGDGRGRELGQDE